MSSAHSINARKCVHAQKPYSCQAFAHESSKVGGRGKRETGKTEARRLMERKAAQQNKNTSEELKQSLPRHSSGKQGLPAELCLGRPCLAELCLGRPCLPELCLGRLCFSSSDVFLFCWAAFLSISLLASVFPVSLFPLPPTLLDSCANAWQE